jgi:hypothetical protein
VVARARTGIISGECSPVSRHIQDQLTRFRYSNLVFRNVYKKEQTPVKMITIRAFFGSGHGSSWSIMVMDSSVSGQELARRNRIQECK